MTDKERKLLLYLARILAGKDESLTNKAQRKKVESLLNRVLREENEYCSEDDIMAELTQERMWGEND